MKAETFGEANVDRTNLSAISLDEMKNPDVDAMGTRELQRRCFRNTEAVNKNHRNRAEFVKLRRRGCAKDRV